MSRAVPHFCTICHNSNDKPMEKPACSQANYFMVVWFSPGEGRNWYGLIRDLNSYYRRKDLQNTMWLNTALNWQTNEMIADRSPSGKRWRQRKIRTASWKERIMRAWKGNAKISNRDLTFKPRTDDQSYSVFSRFSLKVQHRRLLILTDNIQP